jgi:arginase
MDSDKEIAVINVVSQLGAGLQARGNNWQMRVERILVHLRANGLQVTEAYNVVEPGTASEGHSTCRFCSAVKEVIDAVQERVLDCLRRGLMPVTIGGDHSIAIGSVSAASQHLHENGLAPPGLLWVDAHIDMNTPATTPSGNIHGMALATLLGLRHPDLEGIVLQQQAVRADHTAIIGVRYVDRSELTNIAEAGKPAIYSMRDIDQWSVAGLMEEILPRVAINTGGVHLSLDLDSLDPSIAPGVNTPFPGGMNFREVRQVCEAIASTGSLLTLDIVEHNPENGHEEVMIPLLGELISCALGASAMPDITS